MAGIYLHIPFCKKACHYCDFHFSTTMSHKDEMAGALKKELHIQRDYLSGETVGTIYFGGGTPSVLKASELGGIIDEITGLFNVAQDAEITIETNPDDLDRRTIGELRHIPVNRFSIGVQSFYEEDLIWMNRAHTAGEAEGAIKRVQDAGFENITADLIYGYPLLTDEKWLSNIKKMTALEIPHISSYSMTVEPGTALASFISRGRQKPMDEAQSAGQFGILMDELESRGFEHYEISNFALPGHHSRHNSNYWEGVPYLGIGPSAHSFNGDTRQWNVANNMKYITAINDGRLPAETETLTNEDKLNELIMISLRTSKGLNLDKIRSRFGNEHTDKIIRDLQQFDEKGWTNIHDGVVTLSKTGKLYADQIASELFAEPLD